MGKQKGQASHIHEDGNTHTHEHIHEDGTRQVHKHTHSHGQKKAVINRLSKSIGHLEAVKRMVERDEDCSQVLIQLAAVRAALNNTGKVILKDHISHCIVDAVEEGDEDAILALNEAIDKFIK